MDNFWNCKDLKPPPINKFKCKSRTIDIYNVISLLDKGIESFLIPSALRVESNLMRKIIYRFKLQFRLDNGFKLLEYTNRNLNNLFKFNITKELMYLLDEVPKKYNKEIYFPSKQMLEYVLVRLQGYSQVCSRVVETAYKTAVNMKSRLLVGHQWEVALVIIAVSSRIWLFCRNFTTQCCLLYNDLLPLRAKLDIVGTEWLPNNYEFPNDLFVWLNYNWLIDTPDVIVQVPFELPIFSLLDDDDQDVQYTGKYKINDRTVVIPDSDEEDDLGNVDVICGINNKRVKLKKWKIKRLEAKPIDIRDSDSDVEIIGHGSGKIPRSGSFENLMELFDEEDLKRREKRKRKRQNVNETANTTNNIVEIDQTSDDVSIIDQIEKVSDETCCDNNEDIGESIDRDNIPVIEFIVIKDFEYVLNTVQKLEEFLENETFLRKEGVIENCVSSHLNNDNWNYLSYQIKYYVAMTVNRPNNVNKFINKANILLRDILNVKQENSNEKLLFDEQDNETMSKAGKRYLINSMNSIPALQLLLIKENRLREQTRSKCILSHLTDEEWAKLSYDIKCILVMASSKPLRYNSYVRQAKTKMLIKIRNKNEYDSEDYSEDSDIELLKSIPRSTIDQLYYGIRSFKKWGALFDYINSLENYKLPQNLNNEKKADRIKEIVANTFSESPSDDEKKIEMVRILRKKSHFMEIKKRKRIEKLINKQEKDTSIDPDLEKKINEFKSEPFDLKVEHDTVISQIFDFVKAQESYIVPTKRRHPKKLKKNRNVEPKVDSNPKKLTKAEKRKLKAESINAKKIK